MNVYDLIKVLLMPGSWPAEQVVPLTMNLTIMLGRLDFLVVVDAFLHLGLFEAIIVVHHTFKS